MFRTKGILSICAAGLLVWSWGCAATGAAAGGTVRAKGRPNLVYILADDLGYGDVGCLNPGGKIATPHMDRLAGEGMIFTDAHSGSAVCTPTRYGILTGRYAWRSQLKSGVLYGYSRRLIEAGRLTVGEMLQEQGYHTACVGKWHLGMNWSLNAGGFAEEEKQGWDVDYTKAIQQGPTTVGFNYYYGISASLDMPPYVFIQDDHCEGVPTVEKTYIRKGPAERDFEAVNVLPRITEQATAYIDSRAAKAKAGEPFFLYFPLNAPHTPIVPTVAWQGKSGLNAYADFVMQVDDTVGRVLAALDRHGLTEHTIVVMTSDNGCSPQANFPELSAKGHDPSGGFRGHKADIFEGGHRIPFIVRWPGRVAAGSRSDQLVCLTDLMATCAEVLGVTLPAHAGEDSVSLLPALLGTAKGRLREAVVHHSINGSFAIRQGALKLIFCAGSGGWSHPRPVRGETAGLPPMQLYDLAADVGEEANLFGAHKGEPAGPVGRLSGLLSRYVKEGRSTAGPRQANTTPVSIRPEGN